MSANIICNSCGFDWTGYDEAYPQLKGMKSIDKCPECPQVLEEEEDGSD